MIPRATNRDSVFSIACARQSRAPASLSPQKISDLAALTRTVDESALDELVTALLSSDLGVLTTTAILDGLRNRARHQAIEGGAELRALLKEAADRDSYCSASGGCRNASAAG